MPCIGNPAYSFRPILLKLYRYFEAFLWFHMRNLSLAGYNCICGASCMACSFIFKWFRETIFVPIAFSLLYNMLLYCTSMWHCFGKNKKSTYQARQSRLGCTARQWLCLCLCPMYYPSFCSEAPQSCVEYTYITNSVFKSSMQLS